MAIALDLRSCRLKNEFETKEVGWLKLNILLFWCPWFWGFILSVFIDHLLCAEPCAKVFICITQLTFMIAPKVVSLSIPIL